MTHHEHLAQADRLIADCMNHIALQREIITTEHEQGLPTDLDAAGVGGKPARLCEASAMHRRSAQRRGAAMTALLLKRASCRCDDLRQRLRAIPPVGPRASRSGMRSKPCSKPLGRRQI